MRLSSIQRIGDHQFISVLLVITIVVGSSLTINVPSVYACYTWQVGQRVGLKSGTHIRHGSGFDYGIHTTVPHDNWPVDIIGGPRHVDGQEWWDISRRNIDGGGTGWVYKAQAGYDLCGTEPALGRLVLIQDLSLSNANPVVGEQVSASFRVKNSGGQAITLEYLGVQGRLNGDVNGTAGDFNWVQNLTLQPGQEYTYNAGRSFDITGRWRLRPNYKPQGSDWSDVHRENGSIDEKWIEVRNQLSPGRLVLIQDLSVSTRNPQVGEQVSASYRVKNTGGQAISLEYLGVQGRLNGDLNGTQGDFHWIQNLTLQPGEEYTYASNRGFDVAGNWRLRPNYKPQGSDWSDVHRENGTVNEEWLAVQNQVSPGRLVLIEDLSVSPPNPRLGEQVAAVYRVKNIGGQTITLEYLGIQGRLNGDVNGTAGDFQWVQNLTLQPGEEYHYAASRSFDTAGKWTLRPNYKPQGSDWSDVHRENGTVNTVWITVQTTASPGQLVLVDDLSLRSDGSGAWPPQVGDRLVAHIKVRNNGDQHVKVQNIGVRGRKNGSSNWDIGWWTIDLDSGQEWSLDPNNERPLETGNYSFRISYQLNGVWHELGNEIHFSIAEPQQQRDAASLLGQSGPISARSGTTVRVWVEFKNIGTTVWRDSDNFELYAMNNAFESQPHISIGPDVAPGQSRRWEIIMAAPSVSGTSTWQLRHNGSPFGPTVLFNFVTPGAAGNPSDIYSLKLVSGIQLNPATPTIHQTVEASYVVYNPSDSPVIAPYLGVTGRSPTGDEFDNDASFGWVAYVTIPAKSQYTVRVQQTFATPGPYAFYPAIYWPDTESTNGIGNEGAIGEPQFNPSIWKYVNIIDASRPLAQCQINWGFAAGQMPWRDDADDAISVKCTNVRYNRESDTLTVDLEIENKLQTVLERRFEVDGGVTDAYGSLHHSWYIMPSSPWPAFPWYSPSRQIIKDVMFQRNSVLKLIVWRNLNQPTQGYLTASALDLIAVLALDTHIPNNTSNLEDDLRNLLFEIIDVIAKDDIGFINDGFGALKNLQNTTADPFNTVMKILTAMENISNIQAAAPKVHYYYVKSGTAGASSLTLSQIVKKAIAVTRYIRVARLSYDIMTSPKRAEVTISPTTNVVDAAVHAADVPSTLPTSLVDEASVANESIQGNAIAGGSGEHSPGNELFRLIDGDFSTGWATESSTDTNAWVTLRLANGASVLVDEIRIHPGPTNENVTATALKDFHIDISLDGIAYSRLLDGSFTPTELGEVKSFVVNSPVLVNYIRLTVDSVQDSSQAQFVNVAEIEIFGETNIPNDSFEVDNQANGAPWILADGTFQIHNFSYPADVDWVRFVGMAGAQYLLTTFNLGPNADTVLELYDQDGVTFLTSNDDYGNGMASQIIWTAPADGVYYLKVRNYDASWYGEGMTYQLHIQEAEPQTCPTITEWRGEYFNNETLDGPPTLCRNDAAVDFDWFDGSPDPTINRESFSARWTRTLTFEGGEYQFWVFRDDGVRLWVDENLIIDQWSRGHEEHRSAPLLLTSGNHTIRMEMYEVDGWAAAKVRWERVSSCPTITAWKAEYFNNEHLEGLPTLCRNDAAIDFDWFADSPDATINPDHFSARWTRTLPFEAGDYQFRVFQDDGARLWIDDVLVIDHWERSRAEYVSAPVTLSAGEHTIRFETVEFDGWAAAKLAWDKLTASDAYEADDAYSAASQVIPDGSLQTHNFHAPADQDWMRFAATAGVTYEIQTANLGAHSDTYLYLYDSTGVTEIARDDDSGAGFASRLNWIAPQDGTYYVQVRHYSPAIYGSETNYDVSISAAALLNDAYEADDSHAMASEIAADGSPQTHNFHQAGDQDWVKFVATAGVAYAIQTSNLAAASDTHLYVYASDGSSEIAQDDDSGVGLGSHIRWTAPQNGTYYIRVHHYIPSAYGSETSYDLSVQVGATLLSADSLVAQPTDPVIISVAPNQMSGDSDMEITINGSGFSAQPIITLNDIVLTSTSVTNTTLRALVPGNIKPGTYKVIVKNSDGGAGALAAGFTVSENTEPTLTPTLAATVTPTPVPATVTPASTLLSTPLPTNPAPTKPVPAPTATSTVPVPTKTPMIVPGTATPTSTNTPTLVPPLPTPDDTLNSDGQRVYLPLVVRTR